MILGFWIIAFFAYSLTSILYLGWLEFVPVLPTVMSRITFSVLIVWLTDRVSTSECILLRDGPRANSFDSVTNRMFLREPLSPLVGCPVNGLERGGFFFCKWPYNILSLFSCIWCFDNQVVCKSDLTSRPSVILLAFAPARTLLWYMLWLVLASLKAVIASLVYTWPE